MISYLRGDTATSCGANNGDGAHFLQLFSQRSGLEATLNSDEAIDGAPTPVQHAALRIMQEALSNAYRHARARGGGFELSRR